MPFFKRMIKLGDVISCKKYTIYFDLEVPVSIPKYSMFLHLGFLYIKLQDYFKYLLYVHLEILDKV